MPEETKPQEIKQAEPTSQPSSTGGTKPPEPKWLFYVLSFIISLFGIIFGIIYMTKEGEDNKHFGKICLILGLIPSVLGCLCWIISMVFGIGGSFLGGGTEWDTTYTY